MHFDLELPSRIAAGITRGKDLKVEIVTTVGGREFRNKLWGTSLRTWEVPFPNMKLDDPDFIAVDDLYETVDASTHTFNFRDELKGDEIVHVRFEGKLNAVHSEGPWWRYDTLILVEVRRHEEP